MKYLKEYIRHIISESSSTNKLAAMRYKSEMFPEAERCALVYDPDSLLKNAKLITKDWKARFKLFDHNNPNSIIKGVVGVRRVDPEAGPCLKAWQIDFIAGPGYGHILYPLAQALIPKGKLLTPDRSKVSNGISVSDTASNAWLNSLKLNRDRIPFDDIQHQHDIEGNEHHTDDPKDDCNIDPERPHLNFAYKALGSESTLLSQLEANHSTTPLTRELKEILTEEAENFIQEFAT